MLKNVVFPPKVDWVDDVTGEEIELRPATGYVDFFYVSRDGKVLVNYNTGNRLSDNTICASYIANGFYQDGKSCMAFRHRIVAFAWLGEPDSEDMQVDHIDRNRLNNNVDNLRWVSQLENLANRDTSKAGPAGRFDNLEAYLDTLNDKLDYIISMLEARG